MENVVYYRMQLNYGSCAMGAKCEKLIHTDNEAGGGACREPWILLDILTNAAQLFAADYGFSVKHVC